jgi:hypothetical protein
MNERDGNYIIDKLAERLTEKNKLATDGNIVNLIMSMNKYEILQLATMGDVSLWVNERNEVV